MFFDYSSVTTAVSANLFADSKAFSHWNLAPYCSLVTIVLPDGAETLKTNLPALFAVIATFHAARCFLIEATQFLSPITEA